MGIDAKLEDETGKALAAVDDPTSAMHAILPEAGDRRFPLTSGIDWFGDTMFNHVQAPAFIAEWSALAERVPDAEGRRVYEGIRALAERVAGGAHLYLKFYGD